jgi:hypothetical protein
MNITAKRTALGITMAAAAATVIVAGIAGPANADSDTSGAGDASLTLAQFDALSNFSLGLDSASGAPIVITANADLATSGVTIAGDPAIGAADDSSDDSASSATPDGSDGSDSTGASDGTDSSGGGDTLDGSDTPDSTDTSGGDDSSNASDSDDSADPSEGSASDDSSNADDSDSSSSSTSTTSTPASHPAHPAHPIKHVVGAVHDLVGSLLGG